MKEKMSDSDFGKLLNVLSAKGGTKDAEKIFETLCGSSFGDMLDGLIEEELSESLGPEEIYDELVNCYFELIRKLGIKKFESFEFADSEYCRRIIVDGKVYSFDDDFSHNDSDAEELLYKIDCLTADLGENSLKPILERLSKMINLKIME